MGHQPPPLRKGTNIRLVNTGTYWCELPQELKVQSANPKSRLQQVRVGEAGVAMLQGTPREGRCAASGMG